MVKTRKKQRDITMMFIKQSRPDMKIQTRTKMEDSGWGWTWAVLLEEDHQWHVYKTRPHCGLTQPLLHSSFWEQWAFSQSNFLYLPMVPLPPFFKGSSFPCLFNLISFSCTELSPKTSETLSITLKKKNMYNVLEFSYHLIIFLSNHRHFLEGSAIYCLY